MNIQSFVSYPVYPDSLIAQWELDNTQLNGNYKFKIIIKDLYESPDLINEYYHKINYIKLLSYDTIYLKLICTPPKIDKYRSIDICEKEISMFHGLNKDEFNIATDIVRRERLLFENKVGMKVKIYKRKKYGTVCSTCVDPLTNAIINSNCTKCYGTRYGFYDPVDSWAHIVEQPVNKTITETGTSEDKKAEIRLTNEIILTKHDIILDEINNIKWDVSSEPVLIKYRSYPIGQQMIATAVAPKNILYRM